MAKVPKYPETALELLEPRDRVEPLLNKLWAPVLGAATGFGMACTVNFFTRRPAFSGIQKHIIYSVVGYFSLTYIHGLRDQRYADRDAVLRHYVSLHPEDFPLPERKKVGDLLLEWVPIR